MSGCCSPRWKTPGSRGSVVARIARLPIATFGQLLTARRRYDELAEQGDLVIDAVVGMVRHRFGQGSADGDAADDEYDDRLRLDGRRLREPTTGRRRRPSPRITGRSANGAAHDPWADLPEDTEERAELTPLQQLEQFSVPEGSAPQAGGLKLPPICRWRTSTTCPARSYAAGFARLDRVQLVQLLDYERAHANRVAIVLMLENRLTKLLAAGD